MEKETPTGESLEAAAPAITNEQEDQADLKQKTVPLDALEAERSQRQKLADELQMMKDHLALLQSQKENSQQKQPLRDPEDILTYGDFEKALANEKKQYLRSIEEVRVMQKYPDYQEVVTKYLPEILKQNPNIRNSLEMTQDYELAYTLARQSEEYRRDHQEPLTKSKEAEKIIENANRAGSLSSAGGGTPISEAKRYAQMSDEEFQAVVAKNMGFA